MSLKELREERVLLRPLDRSDLRRCVAWFNDPEVTHYLARDGPLTFDEEERWFANYKAKTDELIFAITVDGQHIGNVGLHAIDRSNGRADVGIMIGEKAFWSQGHGTDALRAILRYAFRELRLNKVSLDVIDYNERAIRVYERLGFVREGVKRQNLQKRGKFVDVIWMSILAREFEAPGA